MSRMFASLDHCAAHPAAVPAARAAAQVALVDHDDVGHAEARQVIRDRQPHDAGTDDDDLRAIPLHQEVNLSFEQQQRGDQPIDEGAMARARSRASRSISSQA